MTEVLRATHGAAPATAHAPPSQRPLAQRPLARALGHALPGAMLLSAGILLSPAAFAASYQVTNLGDNGSGSLRDAINQANANPGADTITFDSSVSGSINLSTGSLYITDDLDIQGPGADTLTVNGNGIVATPVQGNGSPGPASGSVFVAGATGQATVSAVQNAIQKTTGGPPTGPVIDVSLSGMTITGGHANVGGGVLAYNTKLNVDHCVISGNTAGAGGGIGVMNKYGGTAVNIADSVISNNTAQDASGSSGSSQSIGGGMVAFAASINMSRSTVQGNVAGGGSAYNIGLGGGVAAVAMSAGDSGPVPGSISVSDSTISGNRAVGTAASGYSYGGTFSNGGSGGGLVAPAGNLTVSNSTITNNSAIGVGGGAISNAKYGTTTRIGNSTITGNNAGYAGGGVAVYSAEETPAPLQVRNSVIAGNSSATGADLYSAAGASSPGPNGTPTANPSSFELAYSLVQAPGSAPIIDQGGNIFGQAPMLGALANNGGPTLTQLPLAGSPLIDAGDPAFAGPPNTDQRGAGFARIVNGRVDIGASESAIAGPPGPGPAGYVAVPGLGDAGKLGLGALLGLAGLAVARRRRKLAPVPRR